MAVLAGTGRRIRARAELDAARVSGAQRLLRRSHPGARCVYVVSHSPSALAAQCLDPPEKVLTLLLSRLFAAT